MNKALGKKPPEKHIVAPLSPKLTFVTLFPKEKHYRTALLELALWLDLEADVLEQDSVGLTEPISLLRKRAKQARISAGED